jgi:hypothetical protein
MGFCGAGFSMWGFVSEPHAVRVRQDRDSIED